MLFNSIEFVLFLPIVFVLYWFVFNKSGRWQNLLLLLASYMFYGWWDWRFLLLIAFTTICTFASGVAIGVCYQKNEEVSRRNAKLFSSANIVVNLLILGVFKYYNFFVASFAKTFMGEGKIDSLLLDIILPVGISFYTFQALSFTIDVYRGKIKPSKDFVQVAAYISFFPQLLAGPIGRGEDLIPQYARRRVFLYEDGADGMRQILWGLFKKVVVADNCAVYVNQVWDSYQTHTGSTLLLAAILYTIQIYGDFSGYSDMAIGVAKLFGIRLKQNFRFPYFSRDIAEFWRRWHISLTSWFRDYVYIPLGGSRVGKWRIVFNTFVIFLLSGLWHGANWTFVVWGAYHAFLFLPLILLGKNKRFKDTVAENRLLPSLKECGQMLMTFMLVTIGWVIFRAESIEQAWNFVYSIFKSDLLSVPFIYVGTKRVLFFTCFALLIEWLSRCNNDYGISKLKSLPYWCNVCALYILIIIILEFAQGSQSFIYFQF